MHALDLVACLGQLQVGLACTGVVAYSMVHLCNPASLGVVRLLVLHIVFSDNSKAFRQIGLAAEACCLI